MLAPPECLQQLKCSMCKRFLSLFPISSMNTDDNRLLSTCGRCLPVDTKTFRRNKIFENLAKIILFPCINSEYGCMKYSFPKDVQQHELTCFYRLTNCVFSKYNNCGWLGRFSKLLEHCKSEHSDLFLEDDEFQIETTKNQAILNIFEYQCEAFLLEYSFDNISKRLKYSLVRLGFDQRINKFYGQIRFENGTSWSFVHTFPEINMDQNSSKLLEMCLDSILDADNTVITGTISISENGKLPRLNVDIEEVFKEFLQCMECNNVLSPPIFTCQYRHCACNSCKNKRCKICRARFQIELQQSVNDGMNFIYYQCQYGCKFIGNSIDLKDHDSRCLKKPYKCLLQNIVDCKWEGLRRNFVKHILKDHKDHIKCLDEGVSFTDKLCLDEEKRVCMFIKFSDNLFKMVLQYKKLHVLWAVEVIDSIETNNFKFAIILSSNDGQTIAFTKRCGQLRSSNDYDIDDQSYTFLHENQIQAFLDDDNVLNYKFILYN